MFVIVHCRETLIGLCLHLSARKSSPSHKRRAGQLVNPAVPMGSFSQGKFLKQERNVTGRLASVAPDLV
jgi:hypothetical protein